MRQILLLWLMLFNVWICFAELPRSFYNKGNYYDLLIVTDTTGNVLRMPDAKIGEGIILSGDRTIAFEQVARLDYRQGSKLIEGASKGFLTGVAVGLAVSAANIETAEEDTQYGTRKTIWLPIWPLLLFPAAGVLIGSAVGVNVPNYKNLYCSTLPTDFHNKGYYSLLRIRDIKGKTILLPKATIGDGVILSGNKVYKFDQITQIEYKKGSKTLSSSIWGAGLGLAAGAYLAEQTEQKRFIYENGHYETKTTRHTWPLYACTAGGSLIGFLVGTSRHKFYPLSNAGRDFGQIPDDLSFDFALSSLKKDGKVYAGFRYQF